MRRLLGIFALVGLLLLPFPAGATSRYESAGGSGERPGVPGFEARKISFSALNGPNGASGHARSHSASAFNDFSGHVTCLLVEGNRAVVGGVMDKAALEERAGFTFMFAVEDNGNPSDPVPDRLSLTFVDSPAVFDPEDCTVGRALYSSLVPITSGNFRVTDAAP